VAGNNGGPYNDVFRVTMLDVACLLALAIQGSKHEDVGYEDLNVSLERLKQVLGTHPQRLKKSTLEGLLWSANLMDEAGEFWSPYGEGTEGFDRFVRRLLDNSGHQNSTFDRRLNVIEIKD
jgi:hypothetical protein